MTVFSNNHQVLTDTFGGEYWKDILLDPSPQLTASDREIAVISRYCDRITQGVLRNVGYCPVQRERDSAAKYYVVFATGHIKGLQLMNDNMIKSFETYMTEREFDGTLFADHSWKSWRNPVGLQQIVEDVIVNKPGLQRVEYWHLIIRRHFFRFTHSEFIAAVRSLHQKGAITFQSPTKRLSDKASLYPV